MQTEYCLSERRRLESECEKKAGLLRSRDKVVENLKAQLLLQEVVAAEAVCLRTQVSAFEAAEKVHVDELNTLKQKNMALEDEKKSLSGKVAELQSLVRVLETTCSGLSERLSRYENLTERLEEFQNAELKVINERVEKLDADLAEMACNLEEKFYPHLLTTISGQRWLLTHGMKLVLVKCLNSSEYLIALGDAISHSIEKGMQDGLAVGIDHGRAVRSLVDIVAYNPSAEADFNFALQELREVDFRLLDDLKSHKDASIEDVMNLLRLESPFADAPGMDSLQPDIEQLKVTIYRSEDQVVLGETSLSFALSVSHSCVERIRENITAERSALLGVWTPLSKPLFVLNLVGASSTSISVPAINRRAFPLQSLSLYAPLPNASLTLYGPTHLDHNLWDIIVDGDLQEDAASTGEQSSPPAPKTAKQLTTKRNQERVKSILLLAILDEYLLKFHNVLDAKSLWAAIKSRFGGNDESKKMQRNVLKHQFECFKTLV
ncbi:hypothetical protein Tco_0243163 [Tanacetum coccineum]